jgi:hypothetical protein
MNTCLVCPDALIAALFAAYSALHWLAVLPVADACVGAGPEGEPSVLQAPGWVLQYVRNCGHVIPSVFPHFSRVLQSLRQCSSTGCAPKGGDCAPTGEDPMTAIKSAAINPRIFNPPYVREKTGLMIVRQRAFDRGCDARRLSTGWSTRA